MHPLHHQDGYHHLPLQAFSLKGTSPGQWCLGVTRHWDRQSSCGVRDDLLQKPLDKDSVVHPHPLHSPERIQSEADRQTGVAVMQQEPGKQRGAHNCHFSAERIRPRLMSDICQSPCKTVTGTWKGLSAKHSDGDCHFFPWRSRLSLATAGMPHDLSWCMRQQHTKEGKHLLLSWVADYPTFQPPKLSP